MHIPLLAAEALSEPAFAEVRCEAVLHGCKWDPQVGDHATLSPFPLLLDAPAWRELHGLTKALATETLLAEEALLSRPDLHRLLGVPPAVSRLLCRSGAAPSRAPAASRIVRFDFHFTSQGWRISEANSDVPGGFTEASHFTRLMAAHYADAAPAGDPAGLWLDAIAAAAEGGDGGDVALLCAPGFMEDQQVIAFLARGLAERGLRAHLGAPQHLSWRDGRAYLAYLPGGAPVGAVVRFYQAEWLPRLPRRIGWQHLFAGSRTPVLNPGSVILTESKRLALLWPHLPPLPTFWTLLPETREPAAAPWRRDDGWLIKAAYGNTGDTVGVVGLLDPARWRRLALSVLLRPGQWVAQRRFAVLPIATPLGPRYPCLGVYAVGTQVAGIYGRLSRTPIIDFTAMDVAVLVRRGDPEPDPDPPGGEA